MYAWKGISILMFVACLYACKAPQKTVGTRTADGIWVVDTTWTIQRLVDSFYHLRGRVDSLEKHVVDLPADQYAKDSAGILRQRGIFRVDSLIVTKGWVSVGVPKDSIPDNNDTSHFPHFPHDTIPVVNKRL